MIKFRQKEYAVSSSVLAATRAPQIFAHSVKGNVKPTAEFVTNVVKEPAGAVKNLMVYGKRPTLSGTANSFKKIWHNFKGLGTSDKATAAAGLLSTCPTTVATVSAAGKSVKPTIKRTGSYFRRKERQRTNPELIDRWLRRNPRNVSKYRSVFL